MCHLDKRGDAMYGWFFLQPDADDEWGSCYALVDCTFVPRRGDVSTHSLATLRLDSTTAKHLIDIVTVCR
jgi:hypothetical protein